MRALTWRLRARQQTRSHRPHSTASIDAGSETSSRNVRSLEMLPTVSPSGSCSENAGRSRPSCARALPLHAALDRRRPRAEDLRAARRAARRRPRPASRSRPRAAWPRRPGRCPGTSAPAAARAPRARRPAGTSITPRGLASADATLATTLLVAMPALDGRPELVVDRRRSSCSTARSMAASPRSAVAVGARSVEPLAAGEIEEHLVDAGDQHRRARSAARSRARAPRRSP